MASRRPPQCAAQSSSPMPPARALCPPAPHSAPEWQLPPPGWIAAFGREMPSFVGGGSWQTAEQERGNMRRWRGRTGSLLDALATVLTGANRLSRSEITCAAPSDTTPDFLRGDGTEREHGDAQTLISGPRATARRKRGALVGGGRAAAALL